MYTVMNPANASNADNTWERRRAWEGFAKINCDGAYSLVNNIASCGVVIRSSDGDFIQAFARRGLNLAPFKKLNYGQFGMVCVWLVTKEFLKFWWKLTVWRRLIRLLEDDCQHANQFWELLDEIRNLKNTFQHCVIFHIFRKLTVWQIPLPRLVYL